MKRKITPKNRQEEILNATRVLLSEEGYDKLSLRKVASNIGIHLKTLQHYFPTKEQLVQSTLEYTQSLYDRSFNDLRPRSATPEQLLTNIVEFLLNDIKDRQTAGFFYQLWARAYVDEHAKSLMQRMYQHHIDNVAGLMAPLNPSLDKSVLRQRAMMLVAMIEGMQLFVGAGKRRPAGTGGIEQRIKDLAVALARQPEP